MSDSPNHLSLSVPPLQLALHEQVALSSRLQRMNCNNGPVFPLLILLCVSITPTSLLYQLYLVVGCQKLAVSPKSKQPLRRLKVEMQVFPWSTRAKKNPGTTASDIWF